MRFPSFAGQTGTARLDAAGREAQTRPRLPSRLVAKAAHLCLALRSRSPLERRWLAASVHLPLSLILPAAPVKSSRGAERPVLASGEAPVSSYGFRRVRRPRRVARQVADKREHGALHVAKKAVSRRVDRGHNTEWHQLDFFSGRNIFAATRVTKRRETRRCPCTPQ